MALWIWMWTLMAAQAGEWKQLRAPQAAATSHLQTNWNRFEENYHPSYVLDGDPKTAWVEGDEGDGIGATVTIPLSMLSSARAVQLRVRNGYQKSPKLLSANGAPAAVTVSVSLQGSAVAQVQASLDRGAALQAITVPIPPGAALDAVSLRIDAVSPGTVYKDTCISDIEVWVDSDVPYQPEVEAARHKQMLAWKAQRLADAAWMAKKQPAWPIADGTWKRVPSKPPANHAAFLALAAEARSAQPPAGTANQRLRFVQTLPVWGDAPEQLVRDFTSYLRASNLAFFEATDEVARSHYAGGPDREGTESWKVKGLTVLPADPAQGRGMVLAFTSEYIETSRATQIDYTSHILRYDLEGRLISWWSDTQGSLETGYDCLPVIHHQTQNLKRLRWSAQGMLIEMQSTTYTKGTDWPDNNACTMPTLETLATYTLRSVGDPPTP